MAEMYSENKSEKRNKDHVGDEYTIIFLIYHTNSIKRVEFFVDDTHRLT